MYGYGDFDGPGFRPSAGEFGRYGGRASLPNVQHWGWRGVLRPLRSPGCPPSGGVRGRGSHPFLPWRRVLMADRRTVTAAARVSPAELADWRAKAAAAGLSLSALLRQAMARTRTWTAPATEVERERTRELARIGANLNQIARWANTFKANAEAVEIVAHLVAIDRALAALAPVGSPDADAH